MFARAAGAVLGRWSPFMLLLFMFMLFVVLCDDLCNAVDFTGPRPAKACIPPDFTKFTRGPRLLEERDPYRSVNEEPINNLLFVYFV